MEYESNKKKSIVLLNTTQTLHSNSNTLNAVPYPTHQNQYNKYDDIISKANEL